MKKYNFNFLTTLVIASVWLCVSCSHNKRTSTYSGLESASESAENTTDEASAPQASAEEVAPASEEVAQSEGVLEEAPSEDLAAVSSTEEQPQDAAVSEIMELADSSVTQQSQEAIAETVTSEPATLDGSEAGFLSTNQASNPESSEAELLGAVPPTPDSFPVDVPAPVMEKSVAPKASRPATHKSPAHHMKPATQKRAEAPAPQAPVQVAQAEQIAKSVQEVIGQDEPAIAEASKPAEPAKQLANAEVGTFFERNLFWIAVCLVGFFGFTFISLKRGKNKDLPM